MCVYVWAAVLDTNFSVMVDRAASRFARAKEASQREKDGESENFRAVYHDSPDAPPFSIFIL